MKPRRGRKRGRPRKRQDVAHAEISITLLTSDLHTAPAARNQWFSVLHSKSITKFIYMLYILYIILYMLYIQYKYNIYYIYYCIVYIYVLYVILYV